MLELKGRTAGKTIQEETGKSLLDLALQHGVDISFSCIRGTCGRCRCRIEEGAELLTEVTDEEWDRLDEEELEQGYRLACQARIRSEGGIRAVHRPYY